MIYLDHAATSMHKPPQVYDAVNAAMRSCTGVGRSGHRPAVLAGKIVYQCRETAGRLFEADPEQVVFTFNATHGLNIAIRSLVEKGDRVVVSGFEHNAVMRPLYQIGAEVVVAGTVLFDPSDTVRAFDRAITPNTKAVICNHVSNVFGYILPLEEIAEICRKRNVPMIVDAAQSAGVLPVSLKRLGASFIAMPGHKGLLGPQGTGMLLCGQMPKPILCGGTGSNSLSPEMPDFLPDGAEAGTHNVPGIAGLLAGLTVIEQRTETAIQKREQELLSYLHNRLSSVPGAIDFYGGTPVQTGVLSIQLSGVDCEYAAQCLAEKEIAVRAGLHCAPLAHRSANTLEKGTIRISVSEKNTKNQMDILTEALKVIS